MKITAIKAQVKNPSRVSVYIDNTYAFSLTKDQLLEQRLHKDLELNDSRLTDLKQLSDFGKLYDRVLRYVFLRPHSEREIVNYCKRKQIDETSYMQIIERLISRKCIDDQAFARSWVESRQLNKAISQRTLRLELKQKGIRDDIIASALHEQAYDELAALRTQIGKKSRQTRYQDQQKLLQYLMRQGFRYDDIKRELASED